MSHSKYLRTGLNVNSLYDLYKEWIDEKYPGSEPVSKHFYRDTFNSFNIGFELPGSDTCNFCDKIDTSIWNLKKNDKQISDDMKKLQEEKEIRLKEAKVPQVLIKSYKNNQCDEVLAIAFDLQQALPTPKLTKGIQYYKRKLWMYNFAFITLRRGAPQCISAIKLRQNVSLVR